MKSINILSKYRFVTRVYHSSISFYSIRPSVTYTDVNDISAVYRLPVNKFVMRPMKTKFRILLLEKLLMESLV